MVIQKRMGLKIFIFKFYLNNSEIFEFAFLFRTFSYDTMLDVVTGVLAMTSTLLLFVIANIVLNTMLGLSPTALSIKMVKKL